MTQMYIKNKTVQGVLDVWEDTPFNRVSVQKNGYEIYVGEVEKAYDGAWYVAGFAPVAPESTYAQLRAAAYPDMTEQLDKLYHDIDGGLFGDAAKTSAFYLARKEVKEAYPKVVEAEGAEAPKGETAVDNIPESEVS